MNKPVSGTKSRKAALIFVEGGGPLSVEKTPCSKGFRTLLEHCGYKQGSFRIIPCGGRDETAKMFKKAHNEALKRFKASSGEELAFVAMIVDSEDAVADISDPCAHLKARDVDDCDCPADAANEQVFLMTTCMETWITADPSTLIKHYNSKFNASALPPLYALEGRDRHDLRKKLEAATRGCIKEQKYEKNQHSFELLEKLNYCTLRDNLPSFRRMIEILDQKLGCSHTPCPSEETVNTDGDR